MSATDLMLAEFCKGNTIGLPRKLFVHLEKHETSKNYKVNEEMIERDMTTVLGGEVLNGRKINSAFPVLVCKQG